MGRIGIVEWMLAGILSVWAGFGLAIQLLVLLMALDFATGVTCAIKRGDLSSHASWRGLGRKTAVLIVVLVSHLLQRAVELGQGIHLLVSLAQTVALAYCWNEVISILENCVFMGAPLPDILQRILAAAPKMTRADEEERLS